MLTLKKSKTNKAKSLKNDTYLWHSLNTIIDYGIYVLAWKSYL